MEPCTERGLYRLAGICVCMYWDFRDCDDDYERAARPVLVDIYSFITFDSDSIPMVCGIQSRNYETVGRWIA